MIQIEPKVDLGTILTAIPVIIGLLRIFMRMGSIETKVEAMWDKFVDK